MKINFSEIFEYLNYCDDSARVVMNDKATKPIAVGGNWLYDDCLGQQYVLKSRSVKKELAEENVRTVNLFTSILKREFTNHSSIPMQRCFRKLDLLKKSKLPLTAGIIRKIYQHAVSAQVNDVRSIAALARNDDRIVFEEGRYHVRNKVLGFLRNNVRNHNRQTVKKYREELITEWGKDRVERTLKRFKIDLNAMVNRGSTLTPKLVNEIAIGLADYHRNDLIFCWYRLRSLASGKTTFSNLPAREQRKLLETLNETDPTKVVESLNRRFQGLLKASYSDLSEGMISFLQKITFADTKELELTFQGKPLEGVINSSPPTFLDNMVHREGIVDKERLQLYHKIMTRSESIPAENLDVYYDEMLTKAVVKKEMTEGTLIPTPWHKTNPSPEEEQRQWYEAKKQIITGRGKFAYFLENPDLKDRLLFRSTSSAPSALDSFTTVLTDIYPFAPPGYKWKRWGQKQEEKALFKSTHKPIRLIGHSLGGSHVQICLMNFLKKSNKFVNNIPDRDLELVTFDSPKLKKTSVRAFNYWLDQPENKDLAKRISIEHYVSEGDPIQHLGEVPLGWKGNTDALKRYKFSVLSPKNRSHPEMKLHPHDRRYFSTRPDVDFKETETCIDRYHPREWTLLEVIRRVVGFVLFPIILIFGFLKRTLFGWRGAIPRVAKIIRKAIPQKPLSGTA